MSRSSNQDRSMTPAVEAIGGMNWGGNIIPPTWFQHICYETEKGKVKPHLLAILILGDIVYWYRPRTIRDEQSGKVISYERKFAADLLQRSYQDLADQFGVTKREAQVAIVLLERLGVISRHFRTITANGLVSSNVLFLEIHPARMAVINAAIVPTDHEKQPENDSVRVRPITKKRDTPHEKTWEPPRKSVIAPTDFRETYTERAQKISQKTSQSTGYANATPVNMCHEALDEADAEASSYPPSSHETSYEQANEKRNGVKHETPGATSGTDSLTDSLNRSSASRARGQSSPPNKSVAPLPYPVPTGPAKDKALWLEASNVFHHWCEVMGHTKAVFSKERLRIIIARLKEGYSVEQLCRAIEGCARSPHHMGQSPDSNPNNVRYDSLTLICRSAEKVDQFLNYYENLPPLGERKQNHEQTTKPRTQGEQLRAVNARIEELRAEREARRQQAG